MYLDMGICVMLSFALCSLGVGMFCESKCPIGPDSAVYVYVMYRGLSVTLMEQESEQYISVNN